MSIKGDVVTYLLDHRGEVVSLTALASKLDVQLKTIRNTISDLRSSKGKGGGGMRNDIVIVSQGYAVKYVGPPAPVSEPKPTPKPSDVPKVKPPVIETPTPAVQSGQVTVDMVVQSCGHVASKVFQFLSTQPSDRDVTALDVAVGTGLGLTQVRSALYHTLVGEKQRNPAAVRYFRRVAKDTYRYVPDGSNTLQDHWFPKPSIKMPVEPSTLEPVTSPTFVRTPMKVTASEPSSSPAGNKRIFEELRVLPDGSILIVDEDGRVYKATEV